jgi:RNA polymerase sigma factor (sigma-70 family)
VEASAIHARAGMGRTRVGIGTPLLRLRSDQQLVAVFRAGNDDAFRVIHDRYRARLLAYMRQVVLGSPAEAEDLVQDVFVRAYWGLRSNERELSLRPWLYRVARNRCVDELRRPTQPMHPEPLEWTPTRDHDPVAATEQRESLARLITDVGRLPEQQRSALLLRELSGMSYADVADVLGTSVPAVKSLLVRARVGLAHALEARDTACNEIREELVLAHERRVRPNALARRHLRDCPGCREYRAEIRGVSKQLAALAPTIGPLAVLAKLIGAGGGTSGGAAAGGAAAGSTTVGGAAAGTTGAVASVGLMGISAGHVTAIVAAAVITAGSAVGLATRATQAPAHPQTAPAVSAATAADDAASTPVLHKPQVRQYPKPPANSGGGGSGGAATSASSADTQAQTAQAAVAAPNPGLSASGAASTVTQSSTSGGVGLCTPATPTAPAPTGLVGQIVTPVTQPQTTTPGSAQSSSTSSSTTTDPCSGAAITATGSQPTSPSNSNGSGSGATGSGPNGPGGPVTPVGTGDGSGSGGDGSGAGRDG